MDINIKSHKKIRISVTNFIVVLALLSTFNLSALTHAQENNFWHISVGNYLNIAQATQELNRLDTLGFKGDIVDISENGTAFNQLRVGCFLDEAIAVRYLNLLRNQLIYPSLSNVSKSETATTSFCLGYEVGIELPNHWHIIRNDEVFLLGITLLDYQRLVGFNGQLWSTFQTENDIPEDWQTSSETILNLACQSTQVKTIDCNVADYSFSLENNGEILWQKGNTVIFKVNNRLNVLRVLKF